MAAAIENAARFNDQTRRMNLAGDDAFGLDLNAAFGEDYSVKAACDDYVIAFDLAFDFGAFAENERLIAKDVALNLRFNAERAGKLQRTLKADSPIKETGPFTLRLRRTTLI
jgi:hypothetical protein